MAGRTRTSNSSIPYGTTTFHLVRHAYGGCTVDPYFLSDTITTSSATLPYLNNRTMTDVVTKDFKKLQASGKIVNNPLSSSVTVESEVPYTLEYEWRILKLGCTPAREYLAEIYFGSGKKPQALAVGGNRYLDVPVITSSKLASMAELAVTAAWSRVSTSEVSALVTLAELDKTAVGLAKTLGRVFRIFKYVRKMQIKNLKKELSFKELQDVYLEARYGLRPLYYDIKGFHSVLNTEQVLGRQTYRGKETYSASVSDKTPKLLVSASTAAGFGIYRDYERTSRVDVTCRAGVLTDITALSAVELMGLGQVAEAAWDLVPFSFIVDWFANVGKTIASWTPNPGIKALASWVVTRKTTTQMSNMGLVTTITPCTVVNQRVEVPYFRCTGNQIKTVTTVSRVISPTRSIIPNFSVKLDPLKLLDLVLIGKNITRSRDLISSYRM